MEAKTLEAEFNKRFFDIPFGNSAFQNIKFVMEAQYTPGRGYRAIGLRLADRIQALKETEFRLRKDAVDIEELEYTIANSSNAFEVRRAKIDLEQKLSTTEYTKKLINDAAVECKVMWDQVQKFPEYTREQFESEELEHFKISLQRQTEGVSGALDSLDIITHNAGEFGKTIEHCKKKLLLDE